MMTLNRVLVCSWISCWMMMTAVSDGQEPSIEMARDTPPEFMTAKSLELNLATIDWRMEQLRAQRDLAEQRRDRMSAQLEQNQAMLEAMAGKLPAQARMMDDTARSQLIGDLTHSMLDTRLELATRAALISQLETQAENSAKSNGSEVSELKMKIQLAESKYQLAQRELKQAEELQKKGFVSEGELMKSRSQVETAELEIVALHQRLKTAENAPKTALLRQIGDLRLELVPLEAKLKAGQEYLDSFAEAASLLSKMESTRREVKLTFSRLERAVLEKDEVDRELMELELLKAQISAKAKAAEKDREN